jgi:hypothetical protein
VEALAPCSKLHLNGTTRKENFNFLFNDFDVKNYDRTNEVDEIHFEITKIKNKLKELSTLHDKHLNRPTLDDNQDEENTINLLTQDVTQVSKAFVSGF